MAASRLAGKPSGQKIRNGCCAIAARKLHPSAAVTRLIRGFRQPGFALATPTWSSFTPAWADSVGSPISSLFATGYGNPPVAVSNVPEPATWLMLGLGFLAVGHQLRQRHRGGPKWVMA
ncbi:PEP-CTERM sorting domain-containing protein [Sandarakinorhabdus limnophila]|jgi:hypothetical protein|uniref:PEP-CTERM sorting domain-containing protein n=1 Tax=Sandarakinorhabdus limnophila TaxID=210512 RepID=UPI0026EE28F6|nr:PEP-CTERM sorting domain-containing protein [Sandarakinorhabdus limnophila]